MGSPLRVPPSAQVPEATNLTDSVVVGKDILELLSSGMYVEPLSVVREYIQNAADSIDAAYAAGMLSRRWPGRVRVTVDPSLRTLRIIDNGTGIHADRAASVLSSIGASEKRGIGARGFRGVGRLGGLAFARRVLFRTRSAVDQPVTTVCWDCAALRIMLADPHTRLSLDDAVRAVVSIVRHREREVPDRFFEVVLEGVLRMRNDALLNEDVLRAYLQQVAPVPLHPQFTFSPGIARILDGVVLQHRIDIDVNGTGPVYRPYSDKFVVSGKRRDRFGHLEPLEFASVDGRRAAVGWILHHSYLGALRSAATVRGLRARVGNMQVGDDSLFADVFPEARFTGWVVGELHILDPKIVPNGRRDGFEHNAAFAHLLAQLAPVGRELTRRCRTTSLIRNRLRVFELAEARVAETAKSLQKGVLRGAAKQSLLSSSRELCAKLERLAKSHLFVESTQHQLAKRAQHARKNLQSASRDGSQGQDPFEGLPRSKRVAYREFITALYDCVPSRRSAEVLERRIRERILRPTGSGWKGRQERKGTGRQER